MLVFINNGKYQKILKVVLFIVMYIYILICKTKVDYLSMHFNTEVNISF